MTINLTKKESEEYFYNALCNALGTGYMNGYGIVMEYDMKVYQKAKAKLIKPGLDVPAYEDVLMQILRDGGTLTFQDEEGDGENTKSITLKDVHDRVCKTPLDHLLDMIKENDDATTADVILQTVFFQEVIFG